MRNIWLIARRELVSYFSSPVAYAVATVFLLLVGVFFGLILFYSQTASLDGVFYNTTTFLLFIGPALTMRLLAEERKSGTIELLLTAPVRDGEVIIGKFLAALLLWLLMLALTLPLVPLLKLAGNPDLGPIAAGYLGLVLLGSAILAIGLLASALTSNQVIAALVAFAFSLLLWIASAFEGLIRGPIGSFFGYLSVGMHFEDFPKGVIDTRHLVFFLSVAVGALFLATRILESRRWKA